MIQRGNMSRAMRARIMARHHHRCAECGDGAGPFDIDHEIALAIGGADDEENMRPLCRYDCHKQKTRADRKIIAKINRIRKWEDAPRRPGRLRRKLNGTVVERHGPARMA